MSGDSGVANQSVWQPWVGWSVAATVSASLVTAGVLGLAGVWAGGPTRGFLAGVVGFLAIELAVLGRTIGTATREAGPQPITVATWITVVRGAALAIVGGSLVIGHPTGSIAWIVAMVYAVAIVLDATDGAVARATDSVTELGARLDGAFDALAIFVGAAVAVVSGFAPPIYLAVGLARYLFVAGIRWRQARGQPVFDLPPSRLRRVLAASQMVVIWLALLPIPGRRLSWYLTSIAMVPFLVGFVRDWLAVSGRRR